MYTNLTIRQEEAQDALDKVRNVLINEANYPPELKNEFQETEQKLSVAEQEYAAAEKELHDASDALYNFDNSDDPS